MGSELKKMRPTNCRAYRISIPVVRHQSEGLVVCVLHICAGVIRTDMNSVSPFFNEVH